MEPFRFTVEVSLNDEITAKDVASEIHEAVRGHYWENYGGVRIERQAGWETIPWNIAEATLRHRDDPGG